MQEMPQIPVGDGHAVTDPNGQYGFRIGVMHKCGHPCSLSYGSRTAADDDRAVQEAQDCFTCMTATLTKGIASTTRDPDIEVISEDEAFLNITHSCGHKGRLLFGGYKFAVEKKAHFQSLDCARCLEETFTRR